MLSETISHYRVLKKLGAGGMGEVYLAEDTKLDRKVAIKFLPPESVADPHAKKRLIREAQAAAKLDHPNICAIHEVGEEDGHSFIVMQYVEGETLACLLKRKSLALGEALDLAVQIADALAEAHSRGIIHRDIKAQNIMITSRGQAKVMDFGLAKVAHEPVSADSEAATQSLLTEPGVIVGTVPYMSPEQVRGELLDARTDVFSFGAMLYEMVSSRSPFFAESAGATFSAILTRNPDPLARFAPETPGELQRIVSKALRKDKEERYQTSKELLVDLRSLKQELEFEAKLKHSISSDASSQRRMATGTGAARVETAEEPAASGEAGATRTTSSAEYVLSEIKLHRKGAAAALAILATVVAVIGFGLFRFIGLNRQSAPFQTMKITRLTSTGKVSTGAIAISPDGKYVVHVVDDGGQQSLWVKHIATASNVQIVPPANVGYRGLTFSHDGNYIYYVMSDRQYPSALYQVPVLGGVSRKLMTNVDSPITFSPDGSRFAYVRHDEKALMIANTEGTGEQKLAGRKAGESWRNPAWSPDGKIIACGVTDSNTQDEYLVEVSVTDGSERPIASQRWSRVRWIAWLSDSGLVMSAADKESKLLQIWTLSYPRGMLRKITSDLSNYAGISLTADSNALVSVRSEREVNIWIAPNGDASRAKQITFGSGNNYGLKGLCWTPDGKTVYSAGPLGNENIWIAEPDGTGQRQLTVTAHSSFEPSVSPDGRYIVFVSDRTGSSNIWRMDLDGSNLKQLTSSGNASQPTCSLDSRWVVYRIFSEKSASLAKVSIDGGDALQLRDKNSIRPAISPDGKLIAYCYDEKPNSYKIAIISFEAGPPIRVFDLLPDHNTFTLRWAPDGRALTYVARRNGIANIWRQPLNGEPPIQLTDFKADEIFSFDWSRDGKQLACSRGADKSDVVLISNSK